MSDRELSMPGFEWPISDADLAPYYGEVERFVERRRHIQQNGPPRLPSTADPVQAPAHHVEAATKHRFINHPT